MSRFFYLHLFLLYCKIVVYLSKSKIIKEMSKIINEAFDSLPKSSEKRIKALTDVIENSIKTKSLQKMFNEMANDYPKLFSIHTQEGRKFINKYHSISSDYDTILLNSILALKSIIAVSPQFKHFQIIIDKYDTLNNQL